MSRTRKKSAKMNMIHFWTLVSRYTRQIVTGVQSFLMLLLQVPVLLLIVSVIYRKDCFYDPGLITYANTTLFIMVFIGSLMGILNSYREITKERDVLSREISGGLDPISYVASKLFVQGVIAAIQAIGLVLGSLLFIDYNFPMAVPDVIAFILTEFGVILASASVGLLISAAVKKSESAVLPVLLIIICQVVLSGVLFELGGLGEYLGWLCPVTWGVSVMGKVLHLNTLNPVVTRAVYEYEFVLCVCALLLIIGICYTLTVSIIKGRNRRKK